MRQQGGNLDIFLPISLSAENENFDEDPMKEKTSQTSHVQTEKSSFNRAPGHHGHQTTILWQSNIGLQAAFLSSCGSALPASWPLSSSGGAGQSGDEDSNYSVDDEHRQV